MTSSWDEFSKSLATPVPRRESLRLFGATLAGALLSPFGFGSAFAGPKTDPCKAFCKCGNKSQQSQCLAECRECNSDPRFLCGSCSGGYVCADLTSDIDNCGACYRQCADPGSNEYAACIDGTCQYACVSGAVRCNGICTDLDQDEYNCGACGVVCEEPGPNESGACIDGQCQYTCVEGADRCNGVCTFLAWDSDNCGVCGNACPESTPYCNQGECSSCPAGTALCGGQCIDFLADAANCGGCGHACAEGEVCSGGWCCNPDCTPDHPYYPNCGNVCGDPCLSQWTGLTRCDTGCVDLFSDPYNCGACDNVCPSGFVCSSGACWDPQCQFGDC